MKKKNLEKLSKYKQTCIEKYGVDHPMKLEKNKHLLKERMLKTHGVENIGQLDEFIQKMKATNVKRYGSISYLNSKKYRKYKNKKFYKILTNSDRLQNKIIPKFNQSEYDGVDKLYKWQCTKCKTIFEDSIDHGKIPRCLKCYPLYSQSRAEKEVCDFCREYYPNLIENDKKILNGLELDVYIPECNLAIEFNGLYWHSELHGNKNKDYHINKSKICKEKNIDLIHVFEDEWMNKSNIVKSILKNKMNKIDNEIDSVNCSVKKVNDEDAKLFLNSNHLQGYYKAIHYGLYYKKELIFLLSFSKYHRNEKKSFEIVRYCNKNNYVVKDGLKKVLNKFIKEYKPTYIITHSDNRYGKGSGYMKVDFEFNGITNPNYFYLNKRYDKRLLKNGYQKNKLNNILENYDDNLSEWDNMKNNNFDRIWDCGASIYIWVTTPHD